MKRIGGFRRKSRYKLKKEVRSRGKLNLTNYFQAFKPGEKVYLTADSSVHKGVYNLRFFGKTGVIKSQIGKCYEVSIKDHKKEKTLIVHPIHMKKCQMQK
jgi:large subunit ribosomal protein L21e